MALTWTSYEVHQTAVLELTGQLCADTVLLLEPELARLLAGERGVLVLNLARVDECDPAGLAMLDACNRAAGAAGVEVRLAAPGEPLRQALRRRGLVSRLRVFGSIDGATRGDPMDLLSPAVDTERT
jgi:anti-sigma B factor antagonist